MAYTIGLDIGSTYTKGLILDSDKNIVGRAMKATGAKLKEAADTVIGMTLEAAGIKKGDIDYCITTGYGRHLYDERDLQVTDLTATARGCCFLFPATRTTSREPPTALALRWLVAICSVGTALLRRGPSP